MKLACLYPTKVGKQLQERSGKERNQLGYAIVKIYYVALAVSKFAGLFSVVLLYPVVFLY